MGRGKFKGKPTGRRLFSTPKEMGLEGEPEALLYSVILKARKDLGLLSPSTPLSILSRQNSSRIGHSSPSPWAPQLPFSISNISDDGCGSVVDNEFLLHEQQLSLLDEQAADPGGYWDQGGLGWKNGSSRMIARELRLLH